MSAVLNWLAAQAQDAYMRQVAGTDSTADQCAKLGDQHNQGVLTNDEYPAQEAKLLS